MRNLYYYIIRIYFFHFHLINWFKIPTVRYQTEGYINKLPLNQATLIRINPDFPMYRGKKPGKVISLMGKGLEVLKEIDKHLVDLDKNNN